MFNIQRETEKGFKEKKETGMAKLRKTLRDLQIILVIESDIKKKSDYIMKIITSDDNDK